MNGFGWQEIDKTLDLDYIRVAGLHRGCKPAVLFDPLNFRPHTMTHWLNITHGGGAKVPTTDYPFVDRGGCTR